MNEQQIKSLAIQYFSSFGRLFGERPNFPSSEDRDNAICCIENAIKAAYVKYGQDPAVSHIVEIDVLDLMEEILNTYK